MKKEILEKKFDHGKIIIAEIKFKTSKIFANWTT